MDCRKYLQFIRVYFVSKILTMHSQFNQEHLHSEAQQIGSNWTLTVYHFYVACQYQQFIWLFELIYFMQIAK